LFIVVAVHLLFNWNTIVCFLFNDNCLDLSRYLSVNTYTLSTKSDSLWLVWCGKDWTQACGCLTHKADWVFER